LFGCRDLQGYQDSLRTFYTKFVIPPPELVLYSQTTQSFKYKPEKLNNLLLEPPQYGAAERGLDRLTIEQPRYVRITDINDLGLLTNDLGVTANKLESQYLLYDDDLLFARSGATVGKTYLHKRKRVAYPCYFAGYLIRFRLDKSKVLPGYVFAFTKLPVFKDWVKAIQRVAAQPNINAREYSELEIPLPPLSVQLRIVDMMNDTFRESIQIRQIAEKQFVSIQNRLERTILNKGK